jgi:hypothetical protein
LLRFSGANRYAILPQTDGGSRTSLSVEIGPRSGDWSALGTATGLITRDIFGLWVEHACTAAGTGLMFAVLPNVDLADMPSTVQQLRAAHSENSAEVQAAQPDPETAKFHAAFWEAGATVSNAGTGWKLEASAPCVALAQELGPTQLSISVATPLLGEPLTITVDRPLHGVNCTSVGDGRTAFHFGTLPSGDWLGDTVTVTCGA